MIDQYGHRLVERGYKIIPLLKAKKRPPGSGWQNIDSTPELVSQWIGEMPEFGIGVLCSKTAAVDMDCRDKSVNNKLLHWLKNNVGLGAIRIGESPKCVAPFQNIEGFKKMRSSEFQSDDGVKHAVEILGDGQQFVAYGIHPVTLKPYEWVSGPTLADVFYDDLPVLTSALAKKFIAYFEDVARDLGWQEVKTGSRQQDVEADALMNYKASLDLGAEEISEILKTLDPGADHDSWVRVGMALHHQFGGDHEGLELFDTWSMDSEKYKEGECAKRWDSFGDYKGASVTMASLKFEAKKSESVELVADELPTMLDRWAFVQVEGSARVLREELNSDQIILYKTDDLKKEYSNRKVLDHSGQKPRMVNLVDLWLEAPDRRTYSAGISFEPDSQVVNKYNLWRGWSFKAVPGDVSPFTDFVTSVIASGDEGHAHYILGWCAQMIQKPQSKVGVGLVLRGSKGSGKTFFGELVGGLCKAHHRIVSKAEHVTGKFNRHLEDTLLLQCDEAYWARNKAAEGALKDLLTNSRITVERKGMDSYSSNNYTRLLFSSNEEWVVPASLDERRFAIFDVSNIKQQDATYFGALRKWYDRGGAEHLLHYFKHFDLNTVDVRKAPRTAALDEQKLHSLDTVDQWIMDCIGAGEFREQRTGGDVLEFGPFEPKNAIYQCYVSSVKGRFENARKESQFWKSINSIAGLVSGECRRRVGRRQVRYVKFVAPKLALEAFNSHHNIDSNVMIDPVAELDPLDPANWDSEVPF
jgi:hypothetical protein